MAANVSTSALAVQGMGRWLPGLRIGRPGTHQPCSCRAVRVCRRPFTSGPEKRQLQITRSSDNGVAPARDQVLTERPPGTSTTASTSSSSSTLVNSSSSNSSSDPAAAPPDDLLGGLATELSDDEEKDGSSSGTPLLASLGILGGILLLMGGGYLFREPIKMFLDFFINAVDEWGYLGYVAYALVYTGLEVLAVPAIPLTMTAGVIFGPIPGTMIVSLSATLAATIAFLIARYAARDRVAALAAKNKRFAAIDRAISKNGFKFVVLLRLSPLLPLAASNYLYGLTSVDLGRYVLGSWLGMLPGTYAYVTAGHVGKAVLTKGEGAINFDSWHLGLALGATLLALGFVGRLATKAVEEADAEAVAEQQAKEEKAKARQAAKEAAAAAGGQNLSGEL